MKTIEFKRASYGKDSTLLHKREYVRKAVSAAVGSVVEIVEYFRKKCKTDDFKFEDIDCTIHVVADTVIVDLGKDKKIITDLESFNKGQSQETFNSIKKGLKK